MTMTTLPGLNSARVNPRIGHFLRTSLRVRTGHCRSACSGLFADDDGGHHVALLNLLGDVEPRLHLAEQVVQRLQLRGVVGDVDEELGTVGIGSEFAIATAPSTYCCRTGSSANL